MDRLDSRIFGIQGEIADRLNAPSAERKEAEAAVNAKVADIEAHIHIPKQENSYAVTVLILMANGTKLHRLCKG